MSLVMVGMLDSSSHKSGARMAMFDGGMGTVG